jgi:Flp pilus assembly protein TadG
MCRATRAGRARRGLPRDERGASLAIVAFSIAALLGMTALAVDFGMLYVARSQAQRAVDASALAAAGWMVYLRNDQDGARAEAIEYAARNDILGTPAQVLPGDVTFPTPTKVRVWLHRTAARGNPVPTIFARILGINHVDVVVKAAAELVPSAGARCVLPIMLEDKFLDANGDSIAQPGEYTDGYQSSDWGTPILIRPFQNPGPANPSWYYPFRQPGMQGASDYRAGIRGDFCGGPNSPDYTETEYVDTEPGAMLGPTLQGFRDLINMDDDYWGTPTGGSMECPVNPDDTSQCDFGSFRIRPVPLFSPLEIPDPGVKPVQIVNFVNVFVEQIVSNGIQVRLMNLVGFDAGGGPGTDPGSTHMIPKLVE